MMNLTSQKIIQVLKSYGINDAEIVETSTRSYNKHFKVISDLGIFNLRHNRNPISRQNLENEARVLNFGKKNNLKIIPEIISSLDHKCYYWENSENSWTLFKWVGDGPKITCLNITKDRRISAGKTLARIHDLYENSQLKIIRPMLPIYSDFENWFTKWEKLIFYVAEKLGKDGDLFLKLISRSASQLEKLRYTKIRKGICHSDYKPSNIIFNGVNVSMIFDFDCVTNNHYIFDLAGSLLWFEKLSNVPSAHPGAAFEFLNSYNKLRKLKDEEKKGLEAFIRWRLLRDIIAFWEYRIKWWYSVRDCILNVFSGVLDEVIEDV